MAFLKWLPALAVLLGPGSVNADYDCLCSYSVEAKVLSSPDEASSPVGYLYEFDCKKTTTVTGLSSQFTAIEFEHKLGYVVMTQDMQHQICPGDPPATDTLYTTTKATITSTTSVSTRIATSTTTSSLTSTTASQHSSTQPPSSSSTITSPSTSAGPTTQTTATHTKPSTTPTPTTSSSTRSPTTTATSTTTPTTTPVPTATQQSTSTPTLASTTAQQSTSTTTPSPTSTSTTPSTTTTTSASTTPMPTTTPATTTTTTTTATTTSTTTTTTEAVKIVNTSNSSLRYIGIGYDLLHGNPGGMERTMVGDDPGMRMGKRVFQLTTATGGNNTAREVEVTKSERCVYNTEALIINDGKSYQDELFYHTVFPKDYPQALIGDAFTLNREFLQVRQEVEGYGAKVYRDKLNSCYLGTLRYRDELANTSDFSISSNFANDVCVLPETYQASEYFKFIDNWGTSVVMGIKLGTFKVARYRTNDQQIIEHIQALTQSERVLYPTGPLKGYGSSITVNVTELSSMGDTGTFGTLMLPAVVGSNSNPAPIELMLYPLTEALTPKYWTTVLRQSTQACQGMSASKLSELSKNLKTALNNYAVYRRGQDGLQNFQPLSAHALQFPLAWPEGTYTLQKATEGCPAGKVSWRNGYRKYDTEDHNANNYFSPNVQQYLSGAFAANNIQTNFCTKTQISVDTVYNREWPSGTYCIMKHGKCPSNFAEGYIYWDDDDRLINDNHNAEGGVLPDGSYGDNTKIYYCCRNDAVASKGIFMPREKSFVLLRFGTTCQSVHGMLVQEVFVRWDDEDVRNEDSAGGAHPADTGGSKDHLLYFCYYHGHQAGTGAPIVG